MGYNVIGMWKYRFGFTLIEILITIGIMAVISAGVMTKIGPGPKQTARDGNRKAAIAQMVSALEIYRSDAGTYPACNPVGANCLISATTGFTTNYLPVVPTDPTSGRSYRYAPLSAVNGNCDGAATKCVKYTLCAALEKITAADANCAGAGSCGATCSYSEIGP